MVLNINEGYYMYVHVHLEKLHVYVHVHLKESGVMGRAGVYNIPIFTILC